MKYTVHTPHTASLNYHVFTNLKKAKACARGLANQGHTAVIHLTNDVGRAGQLTCYTGSKGQIIWSEGS